MKLYQKVLLGTAGTAGVGVAAWRTMFPWLEDDLKLIKFGARSVKEIEEAKKSLLIDKFEKTVAETPKKTFLIFEDRLFSYEFVDQQACRVANMAQSWGLGPRDCVAMMVHNEPAFIWTFLGLQKLGIATALINYNLRMQPLIHSVLAADPKLLIVGAGEDLLEAVIEIVDDLKNLRVFVQGLGNSPAPPGLQSFDSLMLTTLPSSISPLVRQDLNLNDVCSYIYTSGTTGFPKPAIIRHYKSLFIGCLLKTVGTSPTDVIYTPLPLYHSAGGSIGLYGALLSGATLFIKKKFSASQFWPDCRRYQVTVIQYIGELFRYLLAQPPDKLDAAHKVRVAFGNGLRKDIWLEVAQRYKIPLIAEFFGATEGVGLTLNLSNKPGAVGRLSPLLNRLDQAPKALVKFDYATAVPIRDKNGRCIKVGIGEPGLFISKVPDDQIEKGILTVYRSSAEANEAKMVRNAFQDGDLYFNYGDVLVMDQDYFIYFQDRIGDTFRWKGENVSTTEVANVITALPFVHDANVYGVKVPGHDGRGGMVAVTLNEGHTLGPTELKLLYEHVCSDLPSYARPLFVRHLNEAAVTGTFKQRKVELVQEGFDQEKVKDPIFYLDTDRKTYSPLVVSDLSKFLTSRL